MKEPRPEDQALARRIARRGAAPAFPPYNPLWRRTKPLRVAGADALSLTDLRKQLQRAESEFPSRGRPLPVFRTPARVAAAAVAVAMLGGGWLLYRSDGELPAVRARGVVVNVSGFVVVQNGSGRRSLILGDSIRERDHLVTGAGASVEVVLDTGRTIRLEQNTNVKVQKSQILDGVPNTELVLVKGVLMCAVRRMGKKDHYWVKTDSARVEVRGTEFRVTESEGATTVEVNQGSVFVSDARGRELTLLEAGNQVQVISGKVRRTSGPGRGGRALAEEFRALRSGADTLDMDSIRAAVIRGGGIRKAKQRPSVTTGGELIVLKDGSTVRGTVVSQKGRWLIVETAGGVEVIPTARVLKVKNIQ